MPQTPQCALQYQSRLSSPLRDRFDLEVGVSEVSIHALRAQPHDAQNISYDALKSAIETAQALQHQRYQIEKSSATTFSLESFLNSSAPHAIFEERSYPQPDALDFFQTASTQLHLSARSYYRCFRVARTIADLSCSELIEKHHFSEALMLRNYGPTV